MVIGGVAAYFGEMPPCTNSVSLSLMIALFRRIHDPYFPAGAKASRCSA
jgi:hypothetical protein